MLIITVINKKLCQCLDVHEWKLQRNFQLYPFTGTKALGVYSSYIPRMNMKDGRCCLFKLSVVQIVAVDNSVIEKQIQAYQKNISGVI